MSKFFSLLFFYNAFPRMKRTECVAEHIAYLQLGSNIHLFCTYLPKNTHKVQWKNIANFGKFYWHISFWRSSLILEYFDTFIIHNNYKILFNFHFYAEFYNICRVIVAHISHIWHISIQKFVYWLDTQSLKVWWS